MKIRIKHCYAFGVQFGNLKDGSIHEVIREDRKRGRVRGWWVMGVGERVLVLTDEAKIVEN